MASIRLSKQSLRLIATVLCGVVLVFAGILKGAVAFLELPETSEGFWEGRWRHLLIAEYEIFLGVWLISGYKSRTAIWITIGTLSVFAVLNIQSIQRNDVSCGCFGPIELNPWYVLIFDVVTIFLLFLSNQSRENPTVGNLSGLSRPENRFERNFAWSSFVIFGLGLGLWSGCVWQ